MNHAPVEPTPSSEELLRARVDQLSAENRVLELKVQKLQRMLWDKKSERMAKDDKQGVLFNEPAAAKAEPAPTPAAKKAAGGPRAPKGPKPLDPALQADPTGSGRNGA